MATAGYSGTPLLKKLGITPTTRLLVLNAPADYAEIMETDLSEQFIAAREKPELVHLFARNEKEFIKGMKTVLPICRKHTSVVVWVSWYKKAAKIPTDITEDSIRHFALANDLVDVKVCAVSEIWSGLKLVVPLAKR